MTSANVIGRSDSVVFAAIEDLFVPRGRPQLVSFTDLDVDANEIGGAINISGPFSGYNDSITAYVVSIQYEGLSEEQVLGRASAAFDAGAPVSLVSAIAVIFFVRGRPRKIGRFYVGYFGIFRVGCLFIGFLRRRAYEIGC